MYYDFDDDQFICENCPYAQSMYRQFPPPPFQGGFPPFQGGTPFQGGAPFQGGPQFPGAGPQGMPGGPESFGPPSGPPPASVPAKTLTQTGVGVKAVSPGTIRPCRFRYAYIWLDNGRSFWAWLTYVDLRSVAGWRWNGRSWVYFGLDLRRIDGFTCY